MAKPWVLLTLTSVWPAFGADSGEHCPQKGSRPSPANLVPHSAEPWGSSVRLEYEAWNLSSLKVDDSEDAPGVANLVFDGPEGGGTAQVGTRFSDMDEYVLRKIRIAFPSEHTFLHRRLPLEVQLWHEPVIQRDIFRLSLRRAEAQEMLSKFLGQLERWRGQLKDLEAPSAGNMSFPNLRTERDWADAAREDSAEDGHDLLREAQRLQKKIAAIDEKVESLNERLQRPDSARVVVLSMLFTSSREQLGLAAHFVRWLAAAVRKQQAQKPDVKHNASRHQGQAAAGWKSVHERRLETKGDGNQDVADSEEFLFQTLRFSDKDAQSSTDSLSHAAFAYEGSFTRPPCTPVVHWFISSEPLVAGAEDLLSLATVLPGGPLLQEGCEQGGGGECLPDLNAAAGVWWSGPVQSTPEVKEKLPDVSLHVAALGFGGFVKPKETHLSSGLVSQLPWIYVQACCMVLLLCSIVMLATACSMWSHQCCDQ
eukprot:TRINITY_DN27557_c0_g1_i1.p1 TRINITY_DN27557_c0_g1~~TRINITY_DN27557_c0_g1_i1.p1  ORF type:complete len:495 (-),score=105.06 TRINITY_DN27557_c0_g1_i1:43-1485(-)